MTCAPRSTAFANSATATGSRLRKRILPPGFGAGTPRRGRDPLDEAIEALQAIGAGPALARARTESRAVGARPAR